MFKFKKLIRIFAAVILIAFLSSTYVLTWIYFYNPYMIYSPFYFNGLLLLLFIYIIQYIVFSSIYNGFKIGHFRISDIIYSQFTTLIIVNLLTYFEVSLMDRRLLNPTSFIFMCIIQFLLTTIWAIFANRIYFTIFKPLTVLFVHGNSDISNIVKKIKSRDDKFYIKTILNNNTDLSSIKELIRIHDVVFLYDIESDYRNLVLKECYHLNKPFYLTPKLSDIIIASSEWIHLFDTPLFLSDNTTISIEQLLIKRLLDIIISIILIFILLPIFVIVALAIKMSDGGNILYKQERVTIDNRHFKIYKFRSMIMNAEKEGEVLLMSKGDFRVTKIGSLIRKFRIDELPQLFNILKGDMTLVGPRPERPELIKKYCEIIPEFKYRTKVKAGLTGYAQIMGKYNTNIYDKLKLDLMYIENYSFLLDLKILFGTVKYIITPASEESTEGF